MNVEKLRRHRKEIVGITALGLAAIIAFTTDTGNDTPQVPIAVFPPGTACDTIEISSELSEKKADVEICKTPGSSAYIKEGQKKFLPGPPKSGDECRIQRTNSPLRSDPEVVEIGVCERKGEKRLIIGILSKVNR